MTHKNKADVLSLVSPEQAAVVAKQEELAEGEDTTSTDITQVRESYVRKTAFWNEGGPTPHRIVNATVKGPQRDIPIRYYYPREATALPACIFIHGGGFAMGNIDTHDRAIRTLSEETGAVVVGVDYQLSPEAKFPTAIEEAAAVAEYLHEHGAEHGIDTDLIGICGDSAGAHLSLATTLYLRDKLPDISWIKSVLLYYGFYGLNDSVSRRLYGGPWDGLEKEDLDCSMSIYISQPEDAVNPLVDHFSADLTHRIPPCFIAGGDLDPLIDDSRLLAAILKQNGRTVRFEDYPGILHAFLQYTELLPEATTSIKHGAEFYKEHLIK